MMLELQTFGRRPWESSEDEIIRKFYFVAPRGQRASRCVKLLPNRSKDAIRSRARNLKRQEAKRVVPTKTEKCAGGRHGHDSGSDKMASMTIREKVAVALRHASLENDDVDVAITAFLAAAAEQGWHMRPDEATADMKHAAFLAMDSAACRGDPKARAWDCVVGHRAMLAAAPEFEWDK